MKAEKEQQNTTPLLDAITALIETKPAYFRIPGHRLDKGISKRWTDKVGSEIFAYDVTETPFTDDLHSPEGAILQAEKLYADLYQVDKSFLLVNGTTCGNEAMILSAAHEGEKIMVARNAHKSAMMGLVLSGATPVYCMPEIIDEFGIQGEITKESVEACFLKNPDCKALFLVSPSYYGVTSKLSELAKVCHEHGALLLVDEAHGGHMYFHEALPQGAMEAGADMCVQSMHKVTGALTQSSVLHVHAQRVDVEQVSKNLQLVQSTSPNYLLMTSLDCARYELAGHGKEMVQQALDLCAYARKEIAKIEGFCCMDENTFEELDLTRLVISAKKIGLSGFALEEILFQKYAVNMELADEENVLAVVTYANTKEDIDRLLFACKEIARTQKEKENAKPLVRQYPPFPQIPEQVLTPRQAYFAEFEEVSWEEAKGRVSAEMIAPYPPGIPVVYAGERITEEIWNYLTCFKKDNRHIHGSKDGKLETVRVIKHA